LGQTGNPTHPDGLLKFVIGLKKAGIDQGDLDLMMKKNPAKLLGLKDP
jgi:predicted metal-dependent phosphotriesterase family hydrolase